MSFKIHLIIISIIAIVVYFAWQTTRHVEAPPAPQVPVETGPQYSISVIHATWGMNCDYLLQNQDNTRSDFLVTQQENKLEPDNVLEKVSELCNGKMQCTIPLDAQTLGKDPMPECMDKELVVEYRCFSYDRPWKVKSSFKQLDVSCAKH